MSLISLIVALGLTAVLAYVGQQFMSSQMKGRKKIDFATRVEEVRQFIRLSIDCAETYFQIPAVCPNLTPVRLMSFSGVLVDNATTPTKVLDTNVKAFCTGIDRDFRLDVQNEDGTWVALFDIPYSCKPPSFPTPAPVTPPTAAPPGCTPSGYNANGIRSRMVTFHAALLPNGVVDYEGKGGAFKFNNPTALKICTLLGHNNVVAKSSKDFSSPNNNWIYDWDAGTNMFLRTKGKANNKTYIENLNCGC